MRKSESRIPAKGSAVIIGALSASTRRRLAEAAEGTIEPLPNVPDTHLVTAKLKDPRKLFNKLNDVVGTEAVVTPVLVDGEGHQLFPTGQLQVRFKTELDQKTLSEIADRYGLEFTQRNKWSPQQAEFAIRKDDTRYLPEITSAIGKNANVEWASADVRAAFKREMA